MLQEYFSVIYPAIAKSWQSFSVEEKGNFRVFDYNANYEVEVLLSAFTGCRPHDKPFTFVNLDFMTPLPYPSYLGENQRSINKLHIASHLAPWSGKSRGLPFKVFKVFFTDSSSNSRGFSNSQRKLAFNFETRMLDPNNIIVEKQLVYIDGELVLPKSKLGEKLYGNSYKNFYQRIAFGLQVANPLVKELIKLAGLDEDL